MIDLTERTWMPYLIALAVGLLVGIERESSKANRKALGVRTFLLLSLLGAIAGGLQNTWLSALITIFSLSLIFASYFIQFFLKTADPQFGLTTEFAAGTVFIAGFMAHESPLLTATIGPIIALILFSKITLHRFTHSIKPFELKTTITLLLFFVVLINLAPDSTVDPWGLFNPRKFGYLVLTLATLEFSSYILLKVIGEKNSSLVVGFLGGLVSSTAVLISSARQAIKSEGSWHSHLCTALAAQIASLLELLMIVFLISPVLFISISKSIAAAIIFCSICLVLMWRKHIPQRADLTLKSPLDWQGVFRLSFIFGSLLASVSAAKIWLGDDAIYGLSFLAGLFELQGISLANATLFSHGQLNIHIATISILLAVIASLFAKVVVSLVFGRNRFATYLTLIFLPMIAIVFFVGWLQLS